MKSTAKPRPRTLWRRRVRTIHRWLGLAVSLQLLLWIAGGLFMSSMDLDKVRGRHLSANAPPESLDISGPLIAAEEILRNHKAQQLILRQLLGQPVYELREGEQISLWNARTGQRISPLSQEQAKRIALADYKGAGNMASIHWITDQSLETRGRDLPLWRVEFDDRLKSTLYVSPQSGLLVARRNNLWRAFDIVWMLHIMDYKERDNFNNPLLVFFAGSSLAFVLSGILMLWFAYRRSPGR